MKIIERAENVSKSGGYNSSAAFSCCGATGTVP
jgi:hypothetical protein